MSEPKAAAQLPFEAALARLEEIVAQLEAGDLELEAALAAFEEGVALSKRCAALLGDAERRIEQLVESGDGLRSAPFEESGESGDGADETENPF
ncbi:MAG: exodeoxyribonuclease VII small subunit [Deltaproteobacteria bacterium]|nr:exodeoxyribonuclease VII small subunit [Deltaproteobacteria bacterium]MDD9827000.1 exodeoxyribonuclease VII small subunit [Deltaproteobacteria bacterium]MDD9852906.1 exodeoxyribonuclease VII small subunit [Deltaproteobacteria bacterium]MDD9871950.1 exodeoxyribonuclease VII small subunit [Deltaproteobacteria bacterium]